MERSTVEYRVRAYIPDGMTGTGANEEEWRWPEIPFERGGR